MIVVAHPDDELLGLGATMHKLIYTQGVITHVIILGEGITSRSNSRDIEKWKKELEMHHENMMRAGEIIGYHSLKSYDFSDNRFDAHNLLDIVKVIEQEKREFRPDIIFTHHGGDLNIDHQLTFKAVVTACRPMEEETVRCIITFETPSATEWQASTDPRRFVPNLFISIDEEDLNKKCLAMEAYKFESRSFPHPRSSESLRILAAYRGLSVGTQLAEAFEIVRLIFI